MSYHPPARVHGAQHQHPHGHPPHYQPPYPQAAQSRMPGMPPNQQPPNHLPPYPQSSQPSYQTNPYSQQQQSTSYPASTPYQQAPYPTQTTPLPPIGQPSTTPTNSGRVSQPSTPRHSIADSLDADMRTLLSNLKSLVEQYPLENIQALLDNDEKINELVQDAEQTKSLKSNCSKLSEGNKQLAVSNISLKPKLTEERMKLEQLVEQQSILRDKYQINQSKMDGSGNSLDTTLALLQTACAEHEQQSDNIGNDLIEGNKPLEEFLVEFMQARNSYYQHKVKSEKMMNLVNNPARGSMMNGHQGGMPPPPQMQGMPYPMPPRQPVAAGGMPQTGYGGYGGYK